MKLEIASLQPPRGLAELIADLGEGEKGFGGTAVPKGILTLEEYLQYCHATNDHTNLKPGHIPRSFFWFLDDIRDPKLRKMTETDFWGKLSFGLNFGKRAKKVFF